VEAKGGTHVDVKGGTGVEIALRAVVEDKANEKTDVG